MYGTFLEGSWIPRASCFKRILVGTLVFCAQCFEGLLAETH